MIQTIHMIYVNLIRNELNLGQEINDVAVLFLLGVCFKDRVLIVLCWKVNFFSTEEKFVLLLYSFLGLKS